MQKKCTLILISLLAAYYLICLLLLPIKVHYSSNWCCFPFFFAFWFWQRFLTVFWISEESVPSTQRGYHSTVSNNCTEVSICPYNVLPPGTCTRTTVVLVLPALCPSTLIDRTTFKFWKLYQIYIIIIYYILIYIFSYIIYIILYYVLCKISGMVHSR